MSARTRIVVVGATSAIAEACCRLWAAEGPCSFVLVGRDAARLESQAGTLRSRWGAEAVVEVVDFLDPASIDAAAARWARAPVDIALVAHGTLPPQADCQADLALTQSTIGINAVSPALFAEAIAGHMEAAGRGRLAIIGSVAGDRGRRSNYTYGAAKAFLARFAEGMQHRFARTGVRVILIKPGPTDTPMSTPYRQRGGRVAPLDAVAAGIVKAVREGRPTVYLPGRWAAIMLTLRHMPAFLFNRLDI